MTQSMKIADLIAFSASQRRAASELARLVQAGKANTLTAVRLAAKVLGEASTTQAVEPMPLRTQRKIRQRRSHHEPSTKTTPGKN